jgi:hypothetical protein
MLHLLVEHPALGLDGDRKGGGMARLIGAGHQFEVESVGAVLVQGEADQPAPEPGHEINRVGIGHLRRNDEIALVFPVLGIDQDEHSSSLGVFNNFLDGGKLARQLFLMQGCHHCSFCASNSLAT